MTLDIMLPMATMATLVLDKIGLTVFPFDYLYYVEDENHVDNVDKSDHIEHIDFGYVVDHFTYVGLDDQVDSLTIVTMLTIVIVVTKLNLLTLLTFLTSSPTMSKVII